MHICFTGYFGFGNTGDEAILLAELQAMDHLWPQAEFTILVDQVAPLQAMLKLHPELLSHKIRTLPRRSWRCIINYFRQADLVISGGGGLFQDKTGWGSPVYYGGLIILAKLCQAKVATLSQGVGPLTRRLSRIVTGKSIIQADFISVRDSDSARLLEECGVTSTKIHLLPDPALTLKPASSSAVLHLLKAEGLAQEVGGFEGPTGKRHDQRGPLVAICPRTTQGLNIEDLIKQLTRFSSENQARYIFIPMQKNQDDPICHRLHQHFKGSHLVRGDYPPSLLQGLLSCVDLIIGVRLHSLILGASQGTPCVGISYDPKVSAFCKNLGIIYTQDTEVASETFYRCLQETLEARNAVRKHLKQKASELTEQYYHKLNQLKALFPQETPHA